MLFTRNAIRPFTKYNIKFKYLFIDEYQDINHFQYEIVKKWYESANAKLLIVVGDDQQNIYTFRKTNIKYILEFTSNSTYTITENGNVVDKGTYTTGHNKNTTSNIEYDYYKLSNSSLPVPYLIYNYKVSDFNSVNEFPIIIDRTNNIMEVDFSLLGISGYGKIRYKKF